MPVMPPYADTLGGRQQAPRQTTPAQLVSVGWKVPPSSEHDVMLVVVQAPVGRQQARITGGHGLGVHVEPAMCV